MRASRPQSLIFSRPLWCFATLLCLLGLLLCPLAAEEGATGGEEAASAGEPLFSPEEWQRASDRSQGVGANRDRRGAPMEDGQMATALVRMAFALVMVVALAMVAAYLAKRFGLHRRLPGQRGQHMEVLESLPIGPKRMVTLLRIGDHHVVIGHGEHAIASLASFPVADSTSVMPTSSEPLSVDHASPSAASASEQLAKAAESVHPSEEGQPAKIDDFRQRLNRLLGRQGS